MSHYYSVLLYCGAPVPGQPRGPSQFPAHNNGMNNKRGLLTGNGSGFTSPGTLRTTGGPNRNPNWTTASTYKKNVWRGCPKRGNYTYHIFPKNSEPVTNRGVTGSLCVCAMWARVGMSNLTLLNRRSSACAVIISYVRMCLLRNALQNKLTEA